MEALKPVGLIVLVTVLALGILTRLSSPSNEPNRGALPTPPTSENRGCVDAECGLDTSAQLERLRQLDAAFAVAVPDRANCDEIRGTEYRSDREREWYQESCRATVAANIPSSASGGQAPSAGVFVPRVIDGDTIELVTGQRVRYIGIDTPESGPVQECFAQQATARNRQLVEGRTVTLEKDVSETDQYGRLLRYVYVGGAMVNETLVVEGFAQVSTYPPDVKYQDVFLAAQRQAREANRGFWAGCTVVAPTSVPPVVPLIPSQPAATCPQGCTVAPAGCVIKGNISQTSGEKIYHVPGGGSYQATVISPAYGERWFCTEQEAVSNGWRNGTNTMKPSC